MLQRSNKEQKKIPEKHFSGREAVKWIYSYQQFRHYPASIDKIKAKILVASLVDSNVLLCVQLKNEKKVHSSKNIYRFQKLFDAG